MASLDVTYDGFQHCTALAYPQGRTAAMDCPYTGKGEELSPANMVGAGLAGCMLISMGTLAIRDEIDITGATVSVDGKSISLVSSEEAAQARYESEMAAAQAASAAARIGARTAAGSR